ncbi:MAG: FMN-binding negative transcriptional regulator [Rhodoferax sp.]|nr:FMN-binding negative transcriptional regulator [Rhodoferax sp.]MCF8209302.1 FMN-binding negative transcriptional regulator [Rhodoferax sp.]
MTYLPAHFKVTDTEDLHALVRDFPLAVWVQPGAGELLVNHIPFFLDLDRGEFGTLIGHVARANPVWQALGAPGVAVFTGPQAYVSPNWYPSKRLHGKDVPTYNYATVHAHGSPRAVEDPQRILEIVRRLTDQQETSQAHPWKVSDAPKEYIEKLLQAIIGIEFPVQRWVGKWKVSQNRQPPEQLGVVEGLNRSGTEAASQMAALVAKHLAVK